MLTEVRGLNPRGHPAARGASRTIELDDFAKVQPVDAQVPVWDQTRRLWVPTTPTPTAGTVNPTATFEGQQFYRTDLDQLLVWNGVRWDPPWNMGWGRLASNVNAADSIAAAGSTAFLGAGSITVVGNRRIRVTINWSWTIQVGAGQSECQIFRTATQLTQSVRSQAAATFTPGGSLVVEDTPAAGSYNYTFQGFTTATSIQLKQRYDILVEDIGPNGAPV